MLQSIDSYLDEEQGNARLISEQRCKNIFLGTNSHDVNKALYTSVVLDADDFRFKIKRKNVHMTFVNKQIFDANNYCVSDFSPLFVVAFNTGYLFLDALHKNVCMSVKTLLMENYLLIPLYITCGIGIMPYGMSTGKRYYISQPTGGRIDLRGISAKALFYYGNMCGYEGMRISSYNIKNIILNDIGNAEEIITEQTSVKYSIL